MQGVVWLQVTVLVVWSLWGGGHQVWGQNPGTGALAPTIFPVTIIITSGALCGLIAIFLFFICCLSCFLCRLSSGHNEERDKTEPLVLKWADTEEGNVELLAMKTLSETLHDPQDNKVEETKNERVDKETGELTAGTFGFEGKVIKIEETVTVECNVRESNATTDEDQPSTSTFAVVPLDQQSKPVMQPLDKPPTQTDTTPTSATTDATPTGVSIDATPTSATTDATPTGVSIDATPTGATTDATPTGVSIDATPTGAGVTLNDVMTSQPISAALTKTTDTTPTDATPTYIINAAPTGATPTNTASVDATPIVVKPTYATPTDATLTDPTVKPYADVPQLLLPPTQEPQNITPNILFMDDIEKALGMSTLDRLSQGTFL